MMGWGMKRKSILVVAANPTMRALLMLFLGGRGFQVEEAMNDVEAIHKISTASFDLVLLDRDQGKRCGNWLTAHIAASGQSTPLLALAAPEDFLDLPQARTLAKPFRMQSLTTMIQVLANP